MKTDTVKLSDRVKQRLQKLGVGIVYFFGSRAQGVHLPHSDYDIGVVLVDLKKPVDPLKLHSKIYELLSEPIPDKFNGPKLDISYLQTASPALRVAAVKYGLVIYEINPVFRADFEEKVVRDNEDYLPLKREYEAATLAAFK